MAGRSPARTSGSCRSRASARRFAGHRDDPWPRVGAVSRGDGGWPAGRLQPLEQMVDDPGGGPPDEVLVDDVGVGLEGDSAPFDLRARSGPAAAARARARARRRPRPRRGARPGPRGSARQRDGSGSWSRRWRSLAARPAGCTCAAGRPISSSASRSAVSRERRIAAASRRPPGKRDLPGMPAQVGTAPA